MRSKLSAITALDAEEHRALGRPVARRPVPYSLPAMMTSGVPAFWYAPTPR
jgi:hypothetical protein